MGIVRRPASLPRAFGLLLVSLACSCGEDEPAPAQLNQYVRLELEAVEGALVEASVQAVADSVGAEASSVVPTHW